VYTDKARLITASTARNGRLCLLKKLQSQELTQFRFLPVTAKQEHFAFMFVLEDCLFFDTKIESFDI